MPLQFDNSYVRSLPAAGVSWPPARWSRVQELWFNAELAQELGWDGAQWEADRRAACLSGQALPDGAQPVAMAYAGHQFGRFSPQLGDGRALLLGDGLDAQGRRWDLGLKGSGRTPFARGGDGKAAVGPMLREAILGEAMHALGVPTTRALGVVGTGEWVMRDDALPGAVLARLASSHLRVGSFEYFAARQDQDTLQRLLDYALWRHGDPGGDEPPALRLLQAVSQRQARLLARWMGLGFIHGVMNTDNMTVSGETIDYGPCAFLEAHHPDTVFSSIDTQGRYAFGRQPTMAQWNLARLAEALLPLVHDDSDTAVEQASAAVSAFAPAYRQAWGEELAGKLGLESPDRALALGERFSELMQRHRGDHTRSWRLLADALDGQADALEAEWGLARQADPALHDWLHEWRAADARSTAQRRAAMHACNPAVIPRNHQVEAALAAATNGDLSVLQQLIAAVRQPWDSKGLHTGWGQAAPAAQTACYRTFCGT